MDTLEAVYRTLNTPLSPAVLAHKLGLSTAEFRQKRQEVISLRDAILADSLQTEAECADYIAELEERIAEYLTKQSDSSIVYREENLQEGTGKIKALAVEEPQSPEEIEALVRIQDSAIWKLSHYYNKQQPNGTWLITALVARKGITEISLEEIQSVLRGVMNESFVRPMVNYPSVHNDKALFIYTSDKHIAAYVDQQRANYDNPFGEMHYASRMKRIQHEVIYQSQIYGVFKDIFVIDLGDKMDGLDGMTTRKGHKLPQNMSNREAFEATFRVEKDFYDILFHSGCASKYHVIQNANSNHGGDFDYMVSRAVEIYINKAYPDVETRVMEKFIEHVEYGRHVILLTHGKDDSDMKHGLPLHLNDKTENYLNKYLIYNSIDPTMYHISVVKGDLHTNTSQDSYGFRYRNALSLYGGSKWVGTNFGPCKAGCSFDVYEEMTDRVYESRLFFSA